MSKSLYKSLENLAKASDKFEAAMSQSADLALKGFAQRRSEFEKQQKKIEQDIKNGGKLTKHRIPL